jgi:hypothetical protein
MPADPTAAVLQKLEQIEMHGNHEEKNDDEKLVIAKFSISKAIIWTFIGLPWIFLALFRDCVDYWTILYLDLDTLEEESEKNRVGALINERIIKDL